MEGDWASRRALEWARLRRKIVFEAGEEEQQEREEVLGDEKERLGAEVLEVFEDLGGRPDLVEAFSLYIGVGQGPLVIHGGKVGERAGCLFHEVFRLDGHGRLVYEFSGPERGEAVTGLGIERDLLNREVVLEVPGDFRQLNFESVRSLHREAASEDFFSRLAWVQGRYGKPGYSEDGFEDEQRTWKLEASDPKPSKSERALPWRRTR